MKPLRALWLAAGPLLLIVAAACSDAYSGDAGNDGHRHSDHSHDAGFFPVAADASSSSGDAANPDASDTQAPAPYDWRLPPGFPEPIVPSDNPMTAAKVELGRHLFYDRRLSHNQTQSCASCHEQNHAFADRRATGLGSTGEAHSRGSMSLANVAYATTLTWANPLLRTLEEQAAVPLFGAMPVELGMQAKEEDLLARLAADARYGQLFADAFPGELQPISVPNVLRGLASFERALLSGNSPYDRYLHGDSSAITAEAKRGEALFNSEKLECFHCHVGFNLQDSVNYVGKAFPEIAFHNTGLYNVDGRGSYPTPNRGVFELTGKPADMGRFRVPTLRNIAVTAPYMHDGSIKTLSEVLDHYAAGGRTVADGPHAGVGSSNPNKSTFMIGFALRPEEKAAVIAFLESLTDATFLTDKRFANPWADPINGN